MKRVLENVEPKSVMYFFEEISSIPRDSGNEKAVSDYIYEWAKKEGLAAVQDEALNVIIKKPGARGYEEAEPVILQAHMDMVCEKNSDSKHDFLKDPIKLQVKGDFITAKGTTLGADNGIGVAYCMALLKEEIKSPALEILLTTEEESTFNGAKSVSPNYFRGKRLINLDHASDTEVLAGSCGGAGAILKLPISYDLLMPDCQYRTIKIKVKGLKGGHSGEDIHRGNGNAISLLTRVLFKLNKSTRLRLADITAGSSRLAICREAEAVLLIKEQEHEEMIKSVELMGEAFREEYAGVAESLEISAEVMSPKAGGFDRYITDLSLTKLLQFLYLFPDGIVTMRGSMPGTVESSINLGRIRLGSEFLEAEAELRGSFESTCRHIKNQLICLSGVLGCELEFHSEYPAWQYNSESELRRKAQSVYRKKFKKELKPVVVHGGIECGCLLENMPWLDAIAIGSNCWSFHSPEEKMSIESVQRVWSFIKTLLEELK